MTSNLDSTEGLSAIGREVRRHLPGVFWLNLFGPSYRDLIGIRALRSAPAAMIDDDEHRVILRAFESPEDWPDGVARRNSCESTSGKTSSSTAGDQTDLLEHPTSARTVARQAPFRGLHLRREHVTPLPRLDD